MWWDTTAKRQTGNIDTLLTAIFHDNPRKPAPECLHSRFYWIMEVVTTGTTRRAELQSNLHHQQTNSQLFTGRMLFRSPIKQYQSTEGKVSYSTHLSTPTSPGFFQPCLSPLKVPGNLQGEGGGLPSLSISSAFIRQYPLLSHEFRINCKLKTSTSRRLQETPNWSALVKYSRTKPAHCLVILPISWPPSADVTCKHKFTFQLIDKTE